MKKMIPAAVVVLLVAGGLTFVACDEDGEQDCTNGLGLVAVQAPLKPHPGGGTGKSDTGSANNSDSSANNSDSRPAARPQAPAPRTGQRTSSKPPMSKAPGPAVSKAPAATASPSPSKARKQPRIELDLDVEHGGC